MKTWLSALALDGGMFYALWLALNGNEMATNFVLFMTWAFKIVASLLISSLADKSDMSKVLLPIFLEHNGRDWNRYDILTDVFFCAGLAAGGWFWTAGIALFSCLYYKGAKERIIQRHLKTQPVSQ